MCCAYLSFSVCLQLTRSHVLQLTCGYKSIFLRVDSLTIVYEGTILHIFFFLLNGCVSIKRSFMSLNLRAISKICFKVRERERKSGRTRFLHFVSMKRLFRNYFEAKVFSFWIDYNYLNLFRGYWTINRTYLKRG